MSQTSAADPPDPKYELRLLGSFRLRADSREAFLPSGSQRLVALLALRGRQSRSRAAGTLWPNTTQARASGCLRTALWRSHQVCPGLVRVGATALDLSPGVAVDTLELMAGAHVMIAEGRLDGLVQVDGQLLAEWDEPWLDDERERLQQLHLHLLEARAERLAEVGRFGLALDCAMQAMRADPLRESAHRVIIGIHLAEGNASSAYRAYQHCARILREELGVSPSPRTVALLADGPTTDWSTARRVGA